MGDFNSKHSSWWIEDCVSADGKILKTTFDSYNFSQLIKGPTRFGTNSASCIDLIFSDNAGLFKSCGTLPPLHNCDHCPIYGTLSLSRPREKPYKRQIWLYNKGNFQNLRNVLEDCNWDAVFLNKSVDDMCEACVNLFLTLSKTCIPFKVVTIKPKDKPWITSDIKQLIRQRDTLFKAAVRNKNLALTDSYKHIRNEVVSRKRKSKQEYFTRLQIQLQDEQTSNKTWWKASKCVLWIIKQRSSFSN